MQSIAKRRILVVDDHASVRCAVRSLLETEGLSVCGEAADGVEAIEQAKKLRPDLIVLDLAMPHMNGVEAASVIHSTMPRTPIVVLTFYEEFFGPALSKAVGVNAIVSKTEGTTKLVACVKALLSQFTIPIE